MAKVMTSKGSKPQRKAAKVKEDKAPVNPTVTQLSNSKMRRAIIREVCEEVVKLEAERAEITASIATLVNTKIKGQLGFKKGDFNAALRIYKLDREDRAEFLDTLEETFSALGIGKTLDWIEAAQKADTKAVEQERDAETLLVKEARTAGREAGKAGKSGVIPEEYPSLSNAGKAWLSGWKEGVAENAPDGPEAGATVN